MVLFPLLLFSMLENRELVNFNAKSALVYSLLTLPFDYSVHLHSYQWYAPRSSSLCSSVRVIG